MAFTIIINTNYYYYRLLRRGKVKPRPFKQPNAIHPSSHRTFTFTRSYQAGVARDQRNQSGSVSDVPIFTAESHRNPISLTSVPRRIRIFLLKLQPGIISILSCIYKVRCSLSADLLCQIRCLTGRKRIPQTDEVEYGPICCLSD